MSERQGSNPAEGSVLAQGAVLALPAPPSGDPNVDEALPETEDREPLEKRQRLEPVASGLGDADADDEACPNTVALDPLSAESSSAV